MKFTPGPWDVISKKTPAPWTFMAPSRKTPSEISVVSKDGITLYSAQLTKETKTNAHLISATVDMYEALKTVCHECEEGIKSLTCEDCIVNDALSKAEGRTNDG